VKTLTIAAIAAAALALAGTAGAALVPGVFDPDKTGCPIAKVSHHWLHLEKNCVTTTNASAGADITGLEGQPFVPARSRCAARVSARAARPGSTS
jgi:hypothetical protein